MRRATGARPPRGVITSQTPSGERGQLAKLGCQPWSTAVPWHREALGLIYAMLQHGPLLLEKVPSRPRAVLAGPLLRSLGGEEASFFSYIGLL